MEEIKNLISDYNAEVNYAKSQQKENEHEPKLLAAYEIIENGFSDMAEKLSYLLK